MMLKSDPECINLLITINLTNKNELAIFWNCIIYQSCKRARFKCLHLSSKASGTMLKKTIKIKVTPQPPSKSQSPTLKAQISDPNFLNYLDKNLLTFPSQISNNYSLEYHPQHIIFTPYHNRAEYQLQDIKIVKDTLNPLYAYLVRAEPMLENQEELRDKIRCLRNRAVYGVRVWAVEEGRCEKGDAVFWAKGDIREFLDDLRYYMKDQPLQFDVEGILAQKAIPPKYHNLVTQVLLKQNFLAIQKTAQSLSLHPKIIEVNLQQKNPRQKQRPTTSIRLVLSGNRLNIHKLYMQIEKKLCAVQMATIQIQEELFTLEESSESFIQVLTEYNNKIFKIAPNAVVILNKFLSSDQIQQIKRKLKLQIWTLKPSQQFTKQQLRILNSEHQNRSLRLFMSHRKIFWQNLQFQNGQIKITCDKVMRSRFVEECRVLLKSFVREQELCGNFDSCFLVEVFRKYYQRALEEKFNVGFEIGADYIIRNNYSKHSEQIQEELKSVYEKIRKKLVVFLRLKSMKQLPNINLKFFPEVLNPVGYQHNLLGCNLYKLKDVLIKTKPLQSLKKQEQTLIYLLDDRIQDTSIFYKIIQKNKINYQTFLLQIHKPKRPDRLRQYLTQDCPYGHKTVILHAGPEKVTNTLKRDLQTLFTICEERMCVVLFQHQGEFFQDVLRVGLESLRTHGEILRKNLMNQMNNSVSGIVQAEKPVFYVEFFYQGGSQALQKIQKVMRCPDLDIKKLSFYCLEEFDIEKIYSLRYCYMTVKLQKKTIELSPIIAELVNRTKTKQKKKKFLFSFHPNPTHQLVELLINNRTKSHYKITHDQPHPNPSSSSSSSPYSSRPHIQPISQLDPYLTKNLETINKYFDMQYLVISAECITDGLHGREIKYCQEFYMAVEGEDLLREVNVDVRVGKMFGRGEGKGVEFEVGVKELREWYKVVSYKDQLDFVAGLL